VYPILFEIFGYPVSSFGVMMAIAFLVGTWITAIRMKEEGLDPDLATTLMLWVMFGGILGSKLYFAIDVSLRTGTPFSQLFFARDGITWYGGLILATVVGAIGCRVHGIPIKLFADCTAVGGAVGQSLGRVGCFLVGDDYGKATDVPWALSFPEGAPPTLQKVHPTQLYEVAWLLPVAGFLWWRRKKSPFLFGEYLALNGLGRLWIETFRVNERVALGLTEPQLIGLGLIALGMGGWLWFRQHPPRPWAEAEPA
jgi:phosphatidylglycerol:prolipoprotein diacylglycerol transferase